jgi:outer membrane protein
MRRATTLAALMLMLMLAATPAMAQSDPSLMPEGSRDVYLSMATVWQQHPQGRSLDHIVIMPLVSAEWANGVFIDMNTLGMNLSEEYGLDYGPLVSPAISQASTLSDQGSASRRRFTLEAGGYLRWQVSRSFGVGATLMGGSGSDRRGLTLSLSTGLWRQTAAHHNMGVELQTRYANRSALRDDFGSAGYVPEGGPRDAALSLHWRWEVNRKLRLSTRISRQRYLGDAGASPRIEHASGTSLLSMLTYRY